MLRRLRPHRRSTRSYTSQCGLPQTIRQILSSTGDAETATTTVVHGWIRSVRPHKNVAFLDVSDGTTFQGLQAVLLQRPTGLTTGASVRLTGRLAKSPGKGQEKELRVENVEVLGECDSESYPIQKQNLSVEFLRDNAHLRARTANIAAVLRMRGKLHRAFSDWFENEGFVYVHAPTMTNIDCEGAGEAFRVVSDASHDDVSSTSPSTSSETPQPRTATTYLTTSTQLHLEALTSALARVYTLAPSFRAERSQTNRHLSEFWMLEAEVSFLGRGLQGVCDLVESSIKSVLRNLKDDDDVVALRMASAPRISGDAWETWADPSIPWTRVTYTKALDALRAHHLSAAEPRFEFPPPEWGEPFRSEHERWISQFLGHDNPPTTATTTTTIRGSRTGGPVFVTDYPRSLKPFYMWVNDDIEGEDKGRETVACFDLLVPRLGEIAGGSVRESRLDVLQKSMALLGVNEDHHSWYLDLRRYGTTPHGGFGIGFDRLVSWMSGIENVRECIAFPRWAGRVIL